ncbi:MAG: protein-disulfide reductase DsbD family protein [Candidatus Dadabacteria bacterium]
MKKLLLLLLTVHFFASGYSQDSVQVFKWSVSSKKITKSTYELTFTTPGNPKWLLYSPGQDLSDVQTVEVRFADSSFRMQEISDLGNIKTEISKLFEKSIKLDYGPSRWTTTITIKGNVPAAISGDLNYSYGKEMEFYQGTYNFTVPLQGGVSAKSRILIPSIDITNPVSTCGDEDAKNNSLWKLFLIGLGAGILSLLFPCIFPLIPLTISYFTKKSVSRRKGVLNAFWYGFFIFIIFVLLSLPFHILDIQPEILNNISTNVPLNLAFFIFFIAFAISFFGYFDIVLPSSLASKTDSKAGLGDLVGIFFMALTLVIVSFSCTGPILGSLLVGAFTSQNGAWQLTAGMAGFGVGLGLPFLLFALFPNWLQSLPKSGGWMNELKAVFGFIELAMAVKFLSNADLVKQWHLLPREVFVGLWIIIGVCIILYLVGVINFPHDTKRKLSGLRLFFIAVFALITIYLVPGVTNTKSSSLKLISGFPPPVCYSAYKHPVNCEAGVEPLRDYENALQVARQENKPILIDFTGWACVNCRRMEENVWPNEKVKNLMKNEFVVVSLFVDERAKLPISEQTRYKPKNSEERSIVTVGDKWATFQSENFHAVSQPQYAIISPDEVALTKTKAYTPNAKEFADWLECGLEAYRKRK